MGNQSQEGWVQDTQLSAPNKLVKAGLNIHQGLHILMPVCSPCGWHLPQISTCVHHWVLSVALIAVKPYHIIP